MRAERVARDAGCGRAGALRPSRAEGGAALAPGPQLVAGGPSAPGAPGQGRRASTVPAAGPPCRAWPAARPLSEPGSDARGRLVSPRGAPLPLGRLTRASDGDPPPAVRAGGKGSPRPGAAWPTLLVRRAPGLRGTRNRARAPRGGSALPRSKARRGRSAPRWRAVGRRTLGSSTRPGGALNPGPGHQERTHRDLGALLQRGGRAGDL